MARIKIKKVKPGKTSGIPDDYKPKGPKAANTGKNNADMPGMNNSPDNNDPFNGSETADGNNEKFDTFDADPTLSPGEQRRARAKAFLKQRKK